MTENEYADVTDLVKIRNAIKLISDIICLEPDDFEFRSDILIKLKLMEAKFNDRIEVE